VGGQVDVGLSVVAKGRSQMSGGKER